MTPLTSFGPLSSGLPVSLPCTLTLVDTVGSYRPSDGSGPEGRPSEGLQRTWTVSCRMELEDAPYDTMTDFTSLLVFPKSLDVGFAGILRRNGPEHPDKVRTERSGPNPVTPRAGGVSCSRYVSTRRGRPRRRRLPATETLRLTNP